MNNLIQSNKFWAVVAGLLVLTGIAVAAVLIFRHYSSKKDGQQDAMNSGQSKIVQVSSSQAPQRIPSNLPSEPGTKVLENFESTTPDGRNQSTRIVTSYQEPRAVLEKYINFFKKEGYEGGFDDASSKPNGPQIARLIKDNQSVYLVASKYTDRVAKQEITKVEIDIAY